SVFPSEIFIWSGASGEIKKQLLAFEAQLRKEWADSKQPHLVLASAAYKLYLRNAEHQKTTPAAALAIVANSVEDLLQKLQKAQVVLGKSETDGQAPVLRDPQGVYLNSCNSVSKMAFLFPGQGSQQLNMLSDLALYLPQVRHTFEEADAVAFEFLGRKISDYVFPPPAFDDKERELQQKALTDTAVAQPAIAIADIAMFKALQSFGLVPDMTAGHSLGEYAALAAAGVMTLSDLVRITCAR